MEFNSCLTQEILSIATNIKQNKSQTEEIKTQTTVIDGLYDEITNTKAIKHVLDSEEYDSDALIMDIVVNDKNDSNIAQLLNCHDQYSLMQQYMQQNTKGMFY